MVGYIPRYKVYREGGFDQSVPDVEGNWVPITWVQENVVTKEEIRNRIKEIQAKLDAIPTKYYPEEHLHMDELRNQIKILEDLLGDSSPNQSKTESKVR